MKNKKGRIAIICTIGIYAMGAVAFADSQASQNSVQEEKGLTSVILSFFAPGDKEKNVGPEALLLKSPPKEKADKYITLSEPVTSESIGSKNAVNAAFGQPKNELFIQQSTILKTSLIFHMGNAGFSAARPSGFTGLGATTTGHQVTFSYGNAPAGPDSGALGISFGSQFLVEPSSIMSPLYEGPGTGAGYDQLNTRQAYNLSVDMGYAGFKFGASYSQEKIYNDSGMKGFDIRLGYASRKWGADVRFGEYKRERDLFFATTEEFYDTVYALEIGAAYHIHSNIRFTGRFTYYAYGQENDMDALRSSQVFFLGTNVNF
ncbi:hypothetical protein MNBD_ALPHA03-1962 [hydrothermal vent metagenome]|uniref:Porin domain-containing protein n=1 Tax=hydrothermal vent metagenome TaxID=652676 RepID=A0A3B1B8H1_9ZZZZ